MNLDTSTYPGGEAVKITCVVPQERAERLHGLFDDLGVSEMTVQQARRTLLQERKAWLRDTVGLFEELVEIIKFRTDASCENRVIAALVEGFGFGEPGRGSIVSQRCNLVGLPLRSCDGLLKPPPPQGMLIARELAGLSCIVPRGEGSAIARVLLNAGLGAPVVTYAQGVASRARLGLIRVTIPAGKEIVTVFVSRYDIADAFQMVSEVLRATRPGAGFCFWYPIHGGVLDTRIWIGRQPHVASMEQVITALDVVTGDTAWRRKLERASAQVPPYPTRLTSYTIHGTEVDTEAIVNAALSAGAGGATLSRFHRELLRADDDVPSAGESSELIIPEAMLPTIHAAVTEAGLIEQQGFIEIAEVGGASGYRAP